MSNGRAEWTTKRPDLTLAYNRGVAMATSTIGRLGIAMASTVHERCQNPDVIPFGSDYDRAFACGESDALLFLASSEPRRTMAEVEAYERGFECADGMRQSYGLAYAMRQHRIAAEVVCDTADARQFAILVGQSDALLLAMTRQHLDGCMPCLAGVKHVHEAV